MTMRGSSFLVSFLIYGGLLLSHKKRINTPFRSFKILPTNNNNNGKDASQQMEQTQNSYYVLCEGTFYVAAMCVWWENYLNFMLHTHPQCALLDSITHSLVVVRKKDLLSVTCYETTFFFC